MAKKARTPAQRAATARMIAGLRRWKAGRGKSRARRRSAGTAPIVVIGTNPKKKRTHAMAKRKKRSNPSHRRRRRNPEGGVVSIIKQTVATAIPAVAAGGVMALVDNKLLGDKAMPVQVLGKLGLAAAVGYLLRSRPRTAAVSMGAILGGLGYQLAAQLNGGVVATDTRSAMSALVRADPRAMAALVNRNGTLRTTPTLSGMGASMGEGGTALPTMPIFDPVTLG